MKIEDKTFLGCLVSTIPLMISLVFSWGTMNYILGIEGNWLGVFSWLIGAIIIIWTILKWEDWLTKKFYNTSNWQCRHCGHTKGGDE